MLNLLSSLFYLLSPIYCYGDLLDAVQTAGIFNDSKEFVDRPLVADVSEVLDAFSRLPSNVSTSDLREFVLNWTMAAGSDVETWTPEDWNERWMQIQRTHMAAWFQCYAHSVWVWTFYLTIDLGVYQHEMGGSGPFPSIDCWEQLSVQYLPRASLHVCGRCSL